MKSGLILLGVIFVFWQAPISLAGALMPDFDVFPIASDTVMVRSQASIYRIDVTSGNATKVYTLTDHESFAGALLDGHEPAILLVDSTNAKHLLVLKVGVGIKAERSIPLGPLQGTVMGCERVLGNAVGTDEIVVETATPNAFLLISTGAKKEQIVPLSYMDHTCSASQLGTLWACRMGDGALIVSVTGTVKAKAVTAAKYVIRFPDEFDTPCCVFVGNGLRALIFGSFTTRCIGGNESLPLLSMAMASNGIGGQIYETIDLGTGKRQKISWLDPSKEALRIDALSKGFACADTDAKENPIVQIIVGGKSVATVGVSDPSDANAVVIGDKWLVWDASMLWVVDTKTGVCKEVFPNAKKH
jgi:hypothetical protein